MGKIKLKIIKRLKQQPIAFNFFEFKKRKSSYEVVD